MSLTYIGVIVMLLSFFLPKIGVNLPSEQLTVVVQSIVSVIGGLMAFRGRYRVGGINALGMRKS